MIEDNFEPFDSVTVAETLLFQKHMKQPYKQLKHVYRAVVSDQTGDLAENTPISWYQELLRGRPEGWKVSKADLPKDPVSLTGAMLEGWKLMEMIKLERTTEMSEDELWLCEMAAKLEAATPQAINLTEWCIDVFEEDTTMSAIELRRRVITELAAEVDAIDNWQMSLIFLDWLDNRRSEDAKGVAKTPWETYQRDLDADKAILNGTLCLNRLMETQARNIAAMTNEAITAGDNPLEEDGAQRQTAGVEVL